MGIDYVNPKSWEGKVCVGDVNLKNTGTRAEKMQRIFFKIFTDTNSTLNRNSPTPSVIFSDLQEAMLMLRKH
jgi:hypothetical protein